MFLQQSWQRLTPTKSANHSLSILNQWPPNMIFLAAYALLLTAASLLFFPFGPQEQRFPFHGDHSEQSWQSAHSHAEPKLGAGLFEGSNQPGNTGRHDNGEVEHFYAVMMDAGSTGTRIHIFKFSQLTNDRHTPMKLENETFVVVKPGLSSYAHQPGAAASSVVGLLESAKQAVPRHLWAQTPIALRATAGLRLLPGDEAERILNEVRELIESCPFLVHHDSVTLMSGVDEGIFGWFTLNFMLNRIHGINEPVVETTDGSQPVRTAVALDLGGGSTQITFRPRLQETQQQSPSDYIHTITVLEQQNKLYTHSYLGNGLMASRLRLLQTNQKYHHSPDNSSAHHGNDHTTYFSSSCMPNGKAVSWFYNENDYVIKGTNKFSKSACALEASHYVLTCGIHRPNEIDVRDVFIFGYFYDRAIDAGLHLHGNNTNLDEFFSTPKAFKTAAKKSCSSSGFEQKPWLCMDLLYIYALLTEGYGLRDDKILHVVQKFAGKELSWALGAAYYMVSSSSSNSESIGTTRTQTIGSIGSTTTTSTTLSAMMDQAKNSSNNQLLPNDVSVDLVVQYLLEAIVVIYELVISFSSHIA